MNLFLELTSSPLLSIITSLPESASEAKLASSRRSSSTTTAITNRRPCPSVQDPPGVGGGARVMRRPLHAVAGAAMYVSTQMADKMATTKRKRLEGSGGAGRTLGVEGGGDQQRRKPFLIGVAGGTASGKSTVCKKIVELLDQQNVGILDHRVGIISQDCFYRELDDKERALAAKGFFDFDHPSAFDDKLMATTLKNIKDGLPVEIPKYDFVQNARDTENEQTVNPGDVILVEGILVFYFKEIRDMFNMKLFVDTDADTRLSRRVMRDINELKRPLEQILNQYTKFVKPAFEEFCLPTKKYADIIIPRGADNTVAIDLIVQHIRDLFNSKHDGLVPDLSQPQSHNSFESLRSYSSIEEKDLKYTSAH